MTQNETKNKAKQKLKRLEIKKENKIHQLYIPNEKLTEKKTNNYFRVAHTTSKKETTSNENFKIIFSISGANLRRIKITKFNYC